MDRGKGHGQYSTSRVWIRRGSIGYSRALFGLLIYSWGMDLDDETRARLMAAGASSVEFNSPMGRGRALDISGFASGVGSSLLDLGCGYGGLALLAAERHSALDVVGIDSDLVAIERGRAQAKERGLEGRIRFEIGDIADQPTGLDVAVSIGSSHAFGGTREMFQALKSLGLKGAVVGDMVWTGAPALGVRELFGELPVGSDSLAAMASGVGWNVEEASLSTLEEWDEFEGGWIEGVQRVGTVEAMAFANEREHLYRQYRGVAGFGWLYLTQ